MQRRLLHRNLRSLVFPAARLYLGNALVAMFCALAGASAQTNAPSIIFDRDIKPIFDQSCLRCHGGERPKSDFRLTDRESALKGGSNYPDAIVPGNSAASKLIQFVSGEPEDMLMPPADKGEPLSQEQINLLRRWIDEGAAWGEPARPQFDFAISPGVRWLEVRGDENKFRELEGITPGWAGGIEHFSLSQDVDARTRLRSEGHYLYDDHDGAFKLSLDRREVGFIRLGLEQWRSYSDDTGGYYRPAPVPSFDLDQDLYVDHGRAWVDFGLTLPDWPELVLGYEYQYREGEEATLQWGTVGDRNIYPSPKQIDETVHILKLDLRGTYGGWEIEDNARVEFYDLTTSRDNVDDYTTGPKPDLFKRAEEYVSSTRGMNAFRAEKQLRDWWRFSGGYLSSRYNGEDRLNQTTLDFNSLPASGSFWSSDDMVLERASHVWSLANLFQPLDCLSATIGAQTEWTRQDGAGNVHLDSGDPNQPPAFVLQPAAVESDIDRLRLSEQAGIRFTGLPWTIVYAEARFDQEQATLFEDLGGGWHDSFSRDTDTTINQTDARAGFTTSPCTWLSIGGSYRDRNSDSDYDHSNVVKVEADGYSAFITAREIASQEWEARLVLRPVHWFKTTLTYTLVDSEFTTVTDPVPGDSPGGQLTAANYDADVYSANLTLIPWQRLHLTATFSYSDSRTVTADNGNPSVVPYAGDIYAIIASARFVLSERTDLFGAYGFTKSDYSQDNYADGLPLGIDFTRNSFTAGFARKLTANCTVSLRYAWYDYAEPSSGGANDYAAHGVFATFNYRWQ